MSDIRRRYMIRLVLRTLIFIACLVMCFKPNFYDILNGMNFFDGFHVLHLLWIVWMIDMIQQVIPLKNKVALGSQKLFKHRFKGIKERVNKDALMKYIKGTTSRAYKVMVIWILFIGVIAALYYFGLINKMILFMCTGAFYVCDLICVLIWCPFRLILKNKCCTTCRIFNWDHLMMFSPVAFVGGFYSLSLFVMSLICFIVWELAVLIFPERFSEITNEALRCNNCTDKLCTQYCQKLRKK